MALINDVTVTNLKNTKQIKITWSASGTTGVTGYVVYRSAIPYGTFTLLTTITSIATLFYTDTPPILPVNVWYYKVAEWNGTSAGGLPTYGVTFIDNQTWDADPFTQTTLPNLYPSNVDMDFWFDEIKRRNLWLLEQDGEAMKLLKRRYEGTKCPHVTDEAEQCPYPLGKPKGTNACYGTNYIGGYYDNLDIKVRRINTGQFIKITPVGFRLDMLPRFWTIYAPRIDTGDLLVDQQNRRWEVLSSDITSVRGRNLHQEMEVVLKMPRDIVYSIPI